MTIRRSMLAILDEGACYGNQLRTEFERRTGSIRSLNAGQVYATLDRLARDGLVTRDAPADGPVTYTITPAGSSLARAWLVEPAGAEELPLKVALAMTLSRADAAALIQAQRAHTVASLERLRSEGVEAGPRAVVLSALIAAAESELAWLAHTEAVAANARPMPIQTEPPRRGRPAGT